MNQSVHPLIDLLGTKQVYTARYNCNNSDNFCGKCDYRIFCSGEYSLPKPILRPKECPYPYPNSESGPIFNCPAPLPEPFLGDPPTPSVFSIGSEPLKRVRFGG